MIKCKHRKRTLHRKDTNETEVLDSLESQSFLKILGTLCSLWVCLLALVKALSRVLQFVWSSHLYKGNQSTLLGTYYFQTLLEEWQDQTGYKGLRFKDRNMVWVKGSRTWVLIKIRSRQTNNSLKGRIARDRAAGSVKQQRNGLVQMKPLRQQKPSARSSENHKGQEP